MPDFIGEASRNFAPVPDGDYKLIISKILEETVAEGRKSAGATMWRVTYDIDGEGRKVFDNLVFTPKSFWRISNWWRALGHEVIPGQPISTGDWQDHIGCSVLAHLIVVEFNGDKQNDISYFIEPTPGENLPAKKDDLRF